MSTEQQRDWLLSAVISLDILAKARLLTNEQILSIVKFTLDRLSDVYPLPEIRDP
jgi:hypothetical protein